YCWLLRSCVVYRLFRPEPASTSETVGRVYEYSRGELIIDGRTRPFLPQRSRNPVSQRKRVSQPNVGAGLLIFSSGIDN
ncbi:MAG: hypothetical protein ABWU14_20855, partial [Limnospira maxima]